MLFSGFFPLFFSIPLPTLWSVEPQRSPASAADAEDADAASGRKGAADGGAEEAAAGGAPVAILCGKK